MHNSRSSLYLTEAKTKNTLALPYILEEDSGTQKSDGQQSPTPGEGENQERLCCVFMKLTEQLLPLLNPQQWRPGPALTPPRAPQFAIC